MGPDESGGALKLRAEDADDLAVLSACLQDALVPVRDLAYAAAERIFVFVANRFRWESGTGPEPPSFSKPREPRAAGHQRTLCAITFDTVAAVSYRGFRRAEDDRILALLAIRSEPDRDRVAIHLEFSGGAAIRLEAARILCRAKDLGEPWPTRWHPRHDAEEAR